MSISNTLVVKAYVGNASNVNFPIPGVLIDDDSSETLVYVDGVLKVEGALQDYTLTGATPPTTPFNNNVRFNVAPSLNSSVVVVRQLPLTQPTEVASGPYDPDTVETTYDRLLAQIQQIGEKVARAPTLPIYRTCADPVLPQPVAETLIGWDETGTNLALYTPADLIESADQSLTDHIAKTSGAHAASAISVTPAGNLASTDAQSALVELQQTIDSLSPTIPVAANKAVISDGAGGLTTGVTTDTEIGYVHNVTSAIQTQLNAKQATGNYITAVTGDVTAAGPGSVAGTIANSAVTNAKMANMANNTVKGNVSGGSAAPSDLSAAQVIALLSPVAIANGGTGQTTKQAAMDALQPGATKGDILVHTGSHLVSLGVGSDNNVLIADSAQTNGIKWGTAPAGSATLAVATKTSNYALTTSDDAILANASGTFTLTLPTAVGNTGKVFYLKKIDSTTNVVTIATTSSQTIDGKTTRNLATQNEQWVIVSDGSNWQVISHKSTTPWTAYTMTIGAATSAPTKGTVSFDLAQWRRVQDSIQIRYQYKQTAGGAAGTGIYKFPLPTGYTADTTKQPVNTNGERVVGDGKFSNGGDGFSINTLPCYPTLYDSTNMGIMIFGGNGGNNMQVGGGMMGSAFTDLGAVAVAFSFTATVPISGWDE